LTETYFSNQRLCRKYWTSSLIASSVSLKLTYYASFDGFPRLKMVETLDLSGNLLNSSILSSLNGLTALTTFNLGYNNIDNNFVAQGTI